MDNDDKGIGEGGNDAYYKGCVISLSHTVIEPHAMMVEFVDTAIASSAMLATGHTVAIAVLAEEHFVVVWGKNDLFIVTSPLIIINHSVSWVSESSKTTTYHHHRPKYNVEAEQRTIIL